MIKFVQDLAMGEYAEDDETDGDEKPSPFGLSDLIDNKTILVNIGDEMVVLNAADFGPSADVDDTEYIDDDFMEWITVLQLSAGQENENEDVSDE